MGVLVTNAENLISLSVIRSLGKKKIEVTEASSERHAISFFSKYCKHKLQYSSVKNEGKFIEEILEAIKSRKYDVMFPIVMDELLLISKHRDKFLTYTRIPFIEHQTLEKAFDKLYVTNLALENNIPCPKTYFCKEAKELEEIKNELEYPAVIKPRSRSGAAGVVYVNSPGELIEKYIEIYKRFGNPLIQECIPLKGEIFGFEALFNEKSEPRAIFVHRRIRQYPITGGPSTLRESVVNYEVKKLGIKLLKALNWYGVAMVEFKMDPRDGKLKFLEINPRFWGSLPLAIASGVDFPYLLYRMAMDGDIEPVLKYKVGVKCRNLIKDVRCWESAMRDNFTHLGLKIDRVKFTLDFLKFYEKKLHYDLISLDDWMPMVVEIRNFLARKLKGESK